MSVYEQHGLRIFEVMLGHPEVDAGYMKDVALYNIHRTTLFLPLVYCPKLGTTARSEAYPIPEAARLPQDHPLINEIRGLQRAKEKVHKALREEVRRLVTSPDYPGKQSEWQRVESAGTVSMADFVRIAGDLRRALGLGESRWIYPDNRVGELAIVCNAAILPDFMMDPIVGIPLIVGEKVISRLESSGCTGYEVYPVNVVKYKGKTGPPPLYELSVTGRVGLPGPGSDPWFLNDCSTCGLKHIVSYLDRVTVDPEQYDGTDIFCFPPWPQVFVTERFVDAVSHPPLTGASFRPQSASRQAW